jgi:heat-inducible transcriptional repressor
MKLTDRQERILQTVVDEYTATARPISSHTVLQRLRLNISSATIRNELALLEDLGLLMHLHTSGGRIPTALGYRYYIEHLLLPPDLPVDEQITIRHQFYQAQTELEEWLKLAAAIMARRARNVALITAPRFSDVRLKHIELVQVQPRVVLVLVVLTDGSVLQEIVTLDNAVTQEALSADADLANSLLQDLSAAQIEARIDTLPPHIRLVAHVAAKLLQRAVERSGQVYHEGLLEMLLQPEFAATRQPHVAAGERLRRIIEFLQRDVATDNLLALIDLESGIQVVLGGEEPLSELRDYSMVIGRYGDEHAVSGVLGVLGPIRMEYGRAIAVVQYMSNLMTDLLLHH